MKFVIITDPTDHKTYVYVQFPGHIPVKGCEWELMQAYPEDALTDLANVINAEYAAHVAEAFRSALLDIPRDISPE